MPALPSLKYRADLQSLAYLAALPALVAWQWHHGLSWWAYGLTLFLTVGVSVVHHNHTHLRMWRGRWTNRATDYWITLLQGHPTFVFYPAHIANHHRYKHGPRDEARTYRFGGDHNHLLGLLWHPVQVVPVLYPVFLRHLRRLYHHHRGAFWYCMGQYATLGAAWGVLAWLDPWKTLVLVWIPQAHGLHWLLHTNYLQHAHADGRPGLDYARNFEGWLNPLCFNIGLHVAHHEHGRAHWSELPALFERYRTRIHPSLIEPSFGAYWIRNFLASPFVPSLRSVPRMPPPSAAPRTSHANPV